MFSNRTTRLTPTPSADFSASDKSLTAESVLKERQEEWFRAIKKDVYLEECALILQDMIKTSNHQVVKANSSSALKSNKISPEKQAEVAPIKH